MLAEADPATPPGPETKTNKNYEIIFICFSLFLRSEEPPRSFLEQLDDFARAMRLLAGSRQSRDSAGVGATGRSPLPLHSVNPQCSRFCIDPGTMDDGW